MNKIPQDKLKTYYRNALTLAGVNANQSMARDWFIRHRTAKVEPGPFRLTVTKVPTMSVNLDRLRRRIQRMDPTLATAFRRALGGCTVRGSGFRVEVKPTRA